MSSCSNALENRAWLVDDDFSMADCAAAPAFSMPSPTCRIVIIQGHTDAQGTHFCNALADAYASGGRGEGHEVEMIDVARLDFALIRTMQQFRGRAGAG